MPNNAIVAARRARIVVECAHQAEQQQRHGDRERRVLRIHEHLSVVERAGGDEEERDQPGDRAAEAASDPPRGDDADQADCRADQPARLEQAERQILAASAASMSNPPPYM